MMMLQANMHRCGTAHDLLQQYVLEKNIDAVIISEQYRNYRSGMWVEDETKTAAIWIPGGSRLPAASSGSGNCFAWVTGPQFTIISCYLTPRYSDVEFQLKLNTIEDKARQIEGPVIIAGDFNAKAAEWGSSTTDRRGRAILDMAARLGLFVSNSETATTFRRPGCTPTTPDITLASDILSGKLCNWRVLEDYNGSDHQYIAFEVKDTSTAVLRNKQRGTRKWKAQHLNTVTLITALDRGMSSNPLPTTGAETIAAQTIHNMSEACNASMPKIGQSLRRKAAYWWSNEIAELRRKCIQCRRILTRARGRNHGPAPNEEIEFKEARKALKLAIRRSKKEKWDELRNNLNSNPWGEGYKIVAKQFGAMPLPVLLRSDKMAEIVDKLFPTHEPLPAISTPQTVENIARFTPEELSLAVGTLKAGKAPGPDGIPTEVLRVIAKERPNVLLNMYNACLLEGVFPKIWKKQQLTLISKGKGNPERAEAYRPLCMLDTAGKLLERMIKPRLAAAVNNARGLSPRQYGFRPGRSTLGAIQDVVNSVEEARNGSAYTQRIVLLALLDIRNAFNSVRWLDIVRTLEMRFQTPEYIMRLIRSYLQDRVLTYNTADGRKTKNITSGAAQGSILGPDLWNITYDEILEVEMPEETHLVAYADDVAAVIAARTVEQAQRKLNIVMMRTKAWLDSHGLSLASEKTELIFLTKRHIPLEIEMRVNENRIKTQRAVKYLGIKLDSRLTFSAQAQYAAKKTGKVTSALSRLMANVGGPTQQKRKLLMESTNNILLYGCEIWADALKSECRRKVYAAVQRTAALRVASAYRTVSGAAVLVISSTIPIDLLAQERKAYWDAKQRAAEPPDRRAARTETLRRWQQKWAGGADSQWTRRLISNLIRWVERNFGEVDYYVTQLLSGHGYFRKYLFRRGITDDPRCIYGDADLDDAEHTFFHCKKWENERNALENIIGSLTVDTMIDKMIQNEASWNAVVNYAHSILRRKKKDLDTSPPAEQL